MKIGNIIIYPWLVNIPLTKNKYFEIELTTGDEYKIMDCSLIWDKETDHAGIRYNFSICKLFSFYINICDHRHWDDEKDCYCEYDIKDEN